MKKKKTLTQAELSLLEKNENVLRIAGSRIRYTPEFKKKAVREYLEGGKDPRSIFADAGFPEGIVDSKLPNWLLKDWRRAASMCGDNEDFTNNPGGRKRPKDPKTMADKEKIEYYEATIAYKEAENQLLAEARGLPR